MKIWIVISVIGICIYTAIVYAQQKPLLHGVEIRDRRDIESYLDYHNMQNFGTQRDQIKLMNNLIALLYAYQGIISFTDTGIDGVTDKTTADAYARNIYATLWAGKKAAKNEAEQYMKDNDIK